MEKKKTRKDSFERDGLLKRVYALDNDNNNQADSTPRFVYPANHGEGFPARTAVTANLNPPPSLARSFFPNGGMHARARHRCVIVRSVTSDAVRVTQYNGNRSVIIRRSGGGEGRGEGPPALADPEDTIEVSSVSSSFLFFFFSFARADAENRREFERRR